MRFFRQSDFVNGAPGITDGLASLCEICGNRSRIDFQIDDETWRRVVQPSMRAGVICLSCFDKEASMLGIDVNEHIREVQLPGINSTLVLSPSFLVSKD